MFARHDKILLWVSSFPCHSNKIKSIMMLPTSKKEEFPGQKEWLTPPVEVWQLTRQMFSQRGETSGTAEIIPAHM